MKNVNFKSISILLLLPFLFSFSITSKTKSEKGVYIYIDGSNNQYTITPSQLTYDPVQPNESSSGEYSGGAPASKSLSEDQYTELKSMISDLIKDRANHIDNRLMGCGTLVIGKKSLFISSSSQLKSDFENKLKSILK